MTRCENCFETIYQDEKLITYKKSNYHEECAPIIREPKQTNAFAVGVLFGLLI